MFIKDNVLKKFKHNRQRIKHNIFDIFRFNMDTDKIILLHCVFSVVNDTLCSTKFEAVLA